MRMEKVIRWGIAGPGIIANKFAKAVENTEGASLVSVASKTEGKAQLFADEYNISKVFSSYEEMAECDEVDAVYISTAHPFHKECAQIFLRGKKHVLCEKPICVNAKEAKCLMECAEENGVFLMEAMWTRFLPSIKRAKEIAESGVIGSVRGVRADFCYFCTPEEDAKLYLNNLAGGSLLDVGVYGLNFADIFLGDDIESICAKADVQNGVDNQMSILIKYNGGEIAEISSAINVVKPDTGYIYGTQGYIEMPHFYGGDEIIIYNGDKETKEVMPRIGEGFEEEIYEACRCIREGKRQSDVMPLSESLKILKQMDYIREQTGIKYPSDI